MSTVTVSPYNLAPGKSNLLPYMPSQALQSAQPQFFMTSAPLQFNLITAANAQSTNAYAMQVLGRNYHAIQVIGTFSASVLVEATLDGTNWFTLSTITSAGITQYTGIYQAIRVSVSAYTSGNVTVVGISQRT